MTLSSIAMSLRRGLLPPFEKVRPLSLERFAPLICIKIRSLNAQI